MVTQSHQQNRQQNRLRAILFSLGAASVVALGSIGLESNSPAIARSPLTIAQASDEFVDVDHTTTGTVEITTNANGDRILRLNNFSTDPGPALEVILYEDATVPASIEGKGKYISLGALSRGRGTKEFIIPADVVLSEFSSIGIWCEAFDVTFGYAPLN